MQITITDDVNLMGLLDFAAAQSSLSEGGGDKQKHEQRIAWEVEEMKVDNIANWITASKEEGFPVQVAGHSQVNWDDDRSF